MSPLDLVSRPAQQARDLGHPWTGSEHLLLAFLATDSAALTDAELDDARAAGLTDEEIWDVGAITALFAMSNRLAHLTALRPNPEFYLMGRLPRT